MKGTGLLGAFIYSKGYKSIWTQAVLLDAPKANGNDCNRFVSTKPEQQVQIS